MLHTDEKTPNIRTIYGTDAGAWAILFREAFACGRGKGGKRGEYPMPGRLQPVQGGARGPCMGVDSSGLNRPGERGDLHRSWYYRMDHSTDSLLK